MKNLKIRILVLTALLLFVSTAWAADRGTTAQPQLAPMAPRPAPTATPASSPRYTAPVPRPASDAIPVPSPVRTAPPRSSAPLVARPQPRPVYQEPRRIPPPAAYFPNPDYIPQPLMRDPRQMDPRQFRPDYPYYPDMRGRGAPGMGMPQGYGQEQGGAFGAPGNPYGSFGPGQGQRGGPMAGDEQGSMGEFGQPAGTIGRDGKIMGAEEVPQYGRGTSMGDYSGGIVPGKDAGGGGLHGKPTGNTGADAAAKYAGILLEGGNIKSYSVYWDEDDKGKTVGEVLVRVVYNDGSWSAESFDEAGNSVWQGSGKGQSEGGGGDTGKKPWGPKQQKMYQRTKNKELMDQLLNDNAINTSGGLPVDPDQKAQGEGSSSPQGEKAQTGQAPREAIPYAGAKPGAGLVGPSDDVTGKAPIKQQLVLPKGFHVVDPAARKAIPESNLDEEMGVVPSTGK